MQLLGRVDEAVVVHAFLLAELDSPRFGGELRAALARVDASEALIRDADLGDAVTNARRRAVLEDYRGAYLGRNLDSLIWRRALYTPAEVLAIRTIAWDFWLEVTGGTRLPTDAAAYFHARGDDDEHFVPGKNAGSAASGTRGATEDAAARRSSAAARLNHYFAKPS